MGFLRNIERLERMHQIIYRGNTGTAEEFACKVHISRSVLMAHIQEMKDMKAPIAYCRKLKSYYYTKECKLIITFKVE